MKINKNNHNREFNLDLGRLTIRIASNQFAIYFDFETIINWQW